MLEFIEPFQNAVNDFAERMRRKPTKAEKRMCARLEQAGLECHVQEIIGWYIADILVLSKMAIVELDGSQHRTRKGRRKDAVRSGWLKRFGFEIVRIPNHQAASFDLQRITQLPTFSPNEWYYAVKDANTARNMILVRSGQDGKWAARPYLHTKQAPSMSEPLPVMTKERRREIQSIAELSAPTLTQMQRLPPPHIKEDYDAMLDWAIANDSR